MVDRRGCGGGAGQVAVPRVSQLGEVVFGGGGEPVGAAGRGLPGLFGGQVCGVAGALERGEDVLAVLPPRGRVRPLPVEAVLQVLQLGLGEELLAPRHAQLVQDVVEPGRVGLLRLGGVAGGGAGQRLPGVLRAEVGPVPRERGLPLLPRVGDVCRR